MRMDTLKPDRCEIRGENFHWQGDALVIGIGSGRRAGGGQQLCPEALINDGLLHLRIFTGEELILPSSAPRRIRKTRRILSTASPHGLRSPPP